MAQITDTELIMAQLSANSTITNEAVIKDLISKDAASEAKQSMFEGCQYYRSKNTNIMNRNTEYEEYFSETGKMFNENEYQANNKIANGFLKDLIDQKVNYCLSKPMVVKNVDNIISLVDVNTFVRKMSKESSKKSVEWAHPYISKTGEFKIINISGQEIIPVYDTTFEQELLQVIRYYTVSVQEGNETKERYKVELWDKNTVTYYMQDQNNDYYLDTTMDPNPAYHWEETRVLLGKVTGVEGHGWGKVPFVPLWNNEEHSSDLEPVKPHIDIYDIIESDFANNIEDLQDAVIKLINYGGQTDNLSEFRDYLKKHKVIPLDAEGDAQYMTMEIPIEARSKMLEIAEDNIYKFGQGVNVDKVGDGNITNVVIKSRYARLDLKANDTEARIVEFLQELFWFCNEYLKIIGQQQDDIKQMEVTFNRSLIINTAETIKCVVDSKGVISERTAIANHPWVTDVDEELEQMEKDREASKVMLDLDNVGGDNSDTNNGNAGQLNGQAGEGPEQSSDKNIL